MCMIACDVNGGRWSASYVTGEIRGSNVRCRNEKEEMSRNPDAATLDACLTYERRDLRP